MSYIVLIGLLLFCSLFFESFGFLFRILGSINGMSTLGYSLHVQVATISRFGSLFAYPLIAYQVESGISTKYLALIPLVTYSLLSLALYIFSKLQSLSLKFAIALVNVISRFTRMEKNWLNDGSQGEFEEVSLKPKDYNRVVYLGTFAFLFMSSAFFLTSIMANQFLSYRTTIILCTPFISSIGTLLSVLYFDPTLSRLIDEHPSGMSLVALAWKARIRGALLIASFFAVVFFVL